LQGVINVLRTEDPGTAFGGTGTNSLVLSLPPITVTTNAAIQIEAGATFTFFNDGSPFYSYFGESRINQGITALSSSAQGQTLPVVSALSNNVFTPITTVIVFVVPGTYSYEATFTSTGNNTSLRFISNLFIQAVVFNLS
ncbi:TPA: hypothetical protein QCP59_004106, partial [Bacillus cereus]|nr:hypothetical protein [Bacillus cereus]